MNSGTYMTFAVGLVLLLASGVALNHYRRSIRHLRHEIERLAAQDEGIREGDLRYRTIFDTAPVGCVVWEPGFIISDWNRQAEKIFGWSRDDILGRNLIDTLVQESDRPEVMRQSVPLFIDGQTNHSTLQHTTGRGDRVICEWHHAVLRDAEGSPIRGVSLCIDVTRNHALDRAVRTQDRYQRTLFDNFPFMVWLKDTEGRFLAGNQALASAAGAASPDELIGKTDLDYFPAELAEVYRTGDREVMRTGMRKVVEEPIEIGGERRWLETGRAPVTDTDGRLLGTAGYGRDITERKQREAQLRELQAQAVRTQEAQRYREVFDNASDAIVIINVEAGGRLVIDGLNPAAELAFGLPAHRLQGLSIDDIAQDRLGPDTGRAFADTLGHYERCLATGMPASYEGRLRLQPDSEGDIYEIMLSPLADDQGIVRLIAIANNITQRKRYEEALLERVTLEERLTRLAQHVPGYLYVARMDADDRFNILYSSDGIQKIYGISPTEATADIWNILHRIHPDDLAEVRQATLESARTLSPLNIRHRVLHDDGRTLWVEAQAQPMRTEDGSALWHGLTIDITEHRAMEERLRASERELRTLMDNIPDLVLRYDRDGRRVYANLAWERATGIRREEIVGTPPAGLGGDARGTLPTYTKLLEDVITSGQSTEIELCWPMQDESMRWYLHRLVAELDKAGQVVGAVVISNDITERKQTQQHLELLEHAIDLSSDAIYLIDENLRFGYVNSAACHALDYSREELLDMGPTDIDPDLDHIAMQHMFRATSLGSRVSLETRHRTRNGRIFPVELTGTHFERDGARFAISVVRDITERKRIERTLRFIADPGHESDFLTALAQHLSATLDVEYVVIDRLADEPGIAETVALYVHGAPAPNMRYALAGTPCANALGNSNCSYPHGVQSLFPQDTMLAEMGVESYAGLPLLDSTGKPVGLIAVMGTTPMLDEIGVLQVLRIVAPRAAAELERAESDRLLRTREQEFRTLAENSPDPIVRYSLDGRRIYVNPAYEHLSGLPAHEALGKTVSQRSTLPDAGSYQEKFQAAARGERCRVEVLAATPNGQRTWLMHLIPEHDAGGAVRSVLAIGHDITEIKDAQAQMSRFLANAPGFVYTMHRDATGRISLPFISPGFEAQFGLSCEDVRDDITPLRARYHPEDRVHLEAAFQESATQLTPVCVEVRAYHPQHGEFWFESRATPMRQSDGEIHWYGIALVITERKRIEAALEQRERDFHSLAANIPDNVARWDAAGRYLYINPTHERTLGATLDAVLSKPIPDSHEHVRQAIAQVVTTGKAIQTVRQPVVVAGTQELHDVSLVPEFDDQGRVVSVLGIGRDMTSIYRLQEALAARELEFRTLAENLPVAVIRYDAEQRRRYLNPAAERMLRGSATDLLGRVPGGPTVPATGATLAHYRGEMQRTLETDAAQELEFVLDALPVEEREHYEVRFVPEHDADGSPISVLAIWYDITERKRMETALAQREREFRVLVEISPDTVGRYDRDCRRVYGNPALLAGLGAPAQDVLGKTPSETLPGSPLAQSYEEAIRAVLSSGEEGEFTLSWDDIERGKVASHIRLVPERNADGTVDSVLAIGRDITLLNTALTKLRAKEASLAEAQRIAHIGSWELDIATNTLTWSDEIFRIFEIDHTSFNASYEAFLDAIHPDDREIVHQTYLASLENRSPYGIEHRLLMHDGRIKYVLERGESTFDAAGRPLRSTGTVQDITERKNTEILLEQSRALQRDLTVHREEALEEERKRIARELHEELGQVLTALRMNLSMLRVRHGHDMPALVERTQSMIGLVDRAISSMREVVTTLRPSSLDAGIVAALEWLAKDCEKHTGIACHLSIDRSPELSDERATALFRIVQEALTNIARHARATRADIRLENNGEQWQLDILDNGLGFDPSTRFPKNFGLLGMRERARMLGGTLEITSAPGEETRIRLLFAAATA